MTSPARVPVVSQLEVDRLLPYVGDIHTACMEWGENPYTLAAICLRETEAGYARGYKPQGSPFGWGDDPDGTGPMNPYGYGLFQIDRRYHKTFVYSEQARSVIGQARYACRILHEDRECLRRSQSWGTENGADLFERACLASYNASCGKVLHAVILGRNPDSVTTGKDYSADVLARAQALIQLSPRLFEAAVNVA